MGISWALISCWIPVCGRYFLKGSILEKCGKIWKTGRFSGRLWPDWGNTAWAAMAGLGSMGIYIYMVDSAKIGQFGRLRHF